jgi:Zn-dependent peptidase ImmA (M78 family)
MKEKIDLNSDAQSLRKKFGADGHSPIEIFSLVASESDITLIFIPLNKEISGMCVKSNEIRIIAVNSRMTDGRQRFTIAHELYHLYIQNEIGNFVCGMDMNHSKDLIEREADRFASYFIAPHEALREFVKSILEIRKGNLFIEDVVQIEQKFKLSRQATLCRLIDEGFLNTLQAEEMKISVKTSAANAGFDTSLYEPSKEDKQHLTLGRYVSLAKKLLETDKISEGKFRELMIQAFRSDLIFEPEEFEEGYYD